VVRTLMSEKWCFIVPSARPESLASKGPTYATYHTPKSNISLQ
jgi:hypothetical protein